MEEHVRAANPVKVRRTAMMPDVIAEITPKVNDLSKRRNQLPTPRDWHHWGD